MTENSSHLIAAEVAPDPSDDDLDDLDDVLDQFSSTTTTTNQPSDNATASTTSVPEQHSKGTTASAAPPSAEKTSGATALRSASDNDASDDEVEIDDAFAQNLEQGMAELLASADAPPELKAQLEGLLHALDESGTEAPSDERERKLKEEKLGQPETEATGNKSFQDKIQQTMNRMQDSSAAATSASSDTQSKDSNAATDPEALLTQLLHQMEAAGLGNDTNNSKNFTNTSASSNPNADSSSSAADPLNSMLMNMMSELTHKEILYEPMKELHDKFPEWITQHKNVKGDAGKDSKAAAAVSEEDMQRYEEQQRVVAEIVERFERPGYSDDSVEDREFVVERMQMMQAAGSPPPDLVGDIGATQEALADLESGCPQQ